jgi:hypothetical protein
MQDPAYRFPRRPLPGSSLSSNAARRLLQICHETLKDGIGDAPLETPQRFLTRFALREFLTVVGSTPNVRPGLAYRDHVHGVIEVTVARQREPVPYHLPARSLHRRGAGVGGEVVGLGREAPHVAYPVPMILAARVWDQYQRSR